MHDDEDEDEPMHQRGRRVVPITLAPVPWLSRRASGFWDSPETVFRDELRKRKAEQRGRGRANGAAHAG
jgi:hypothetical protein